MRPPLGFMRRFMREVYAEVYAEVFAEVYAEVYADLLTLNGRLPLEDSSVLDDPVLVLIVMMRSIV